MRRWSHPRTQGDRALANAHVAVIDVVLLLLDQRTEPLEVTSSRRVAQIG